MGPPWIVGEADEFLNNRISFEASKACGKIAQGGMANEALEISDRKLRHIKDGKAFERGRIGDGLKVSKALHGFQTDAPEVSQVAKRRQSFYVFQRLQKEKL
jgi:hypothetical protein